MQGVEFKCNGDGICTIIINADFADNILTIPAKSNNNDDVVSLKFNSRDVERKIKKIFLPSTFRNVFYAGVMDELEEIIVSSDNPWFSSFEGVLFDKNLEILLILPPKKSGKFYAPSSVRKVASEALDNVCGQLEEIIFQDGLQHIENYSLYGSKYVTLPATLTQIDDEAFSGGNEYMWADPIIRAPRNSVAHRFAIKKGYRYMPSDCTITWNADTWIKKFQAENKNWRPLRCEVWENTRSIVASGGYLLTNGDSVVISDNKTKRYSQFYSQPFRASFERQVNPPLITVVPDDCLDVAHEWVDESTHNKSECNDIAVLNMASRRNPGGGVTNGAGAQEEYLFRCSDYHKFLYRYAQYAEQYDVTRSHYQYPLDENFGGIFSQAVTIFRENESKGYSLIDKPWKVNMIAVAGMNSPRLVFENGEERIAPELVEGVKNKIRTIFRIACDRGQKNLVLGALGCGAFHNPPKHVAELFRDVLCEQEFFGAFRKICFAVKTSHTSRGDTNFSSFKKILDGFVPVLKEDPPNKAYETQIKKIVIARDSYAILMSNGQVRVVDIRTGASHEYRRFRKSIDIAAGFHHVIGLRKDGNVVFKSVGSQAPTYRGINMFGGCAVYACELHSAMLRRDGTVVGVDHSYSTGLEKISKKSSRSELMLASQNYLRQSAINAGIPKYSDVINKWKNIKQVALTFEKPYALTNDGKFLCGDHEIIDFQESIHGEIIQIDAFGCYYSAVTVVALYEDGTVKGKCEDQDIEDISDWEKVKKVCCGSHAAVMGLTEEGEVLLSKSCKFKDRQDNEVTELGNIIDIAANFEHFIALSRTGEIIYLRVC